MRHPLLACLAGALLVAAAAAPASAQSSLAVDAARAHLDAQAKGLGAGGSTFTVTDAHTSRSGVTYVYLRQQVAGIEVAGSETTVAVRADGTVGHVAGTLVPGLGSVSQRAPSLDARGAVAAAAARVQAATGALSIAEPAAGASRRTVFAAQPDALAPVTARLVYHAEAGRAPLLAWEVGPLEVRGARPHAWLVRVDAATGAELWRADLIDFDPGPDPAHLAAVPFDGRPLASRRALAPPSVPGSYRVYPVPQEGPNEGPSVLIVAPENDLASPFGWHDTDGVDGAEFTITRGNNVHAYLDTNDDGAPDAGQDVDGGAALVFDFPADLTQAPSAYRPASVTNLFFWSNLLHDILYQYGFDEASGNFQVNNYGRGGVASDDVRAEGQDGGGTNNANFFTPADGQRPRMQMYIYTGPTPDRDGSFSNMTLVHEYGHGLTNRLTGGPSTAGCLSNNEQMGEGWSDWLAAMFTMEPTDTRTTHRPYGPYPRGLDPNGPGLRPAAMNTDFSRNNYTYQRTRSGLSVPHGVGFVWSTILWEVAWEMIDDYGFSADLYDADGTAGNQMMIQLMVEGLKLQPCSPGFVDGRDAILAADALLYPDAGNPGRGLHYETLWSGFARRGLGASASQGSSDSNADNTEAFDLPLPPPVLDLAQSSLSATVLSGESTTRTFSVGNTAPPGSAPLNATIQVLNLTQPDAEPPALAPSGRLRVLGAPAKGDASADGTGARGTGGPDAYGYMWSDSDEPDGPEVAFKDIATTGTAISFSAADDGSATVALPFPFPFYGVDRSTVTVSTNGYLTFGDAGTAYENTPIPSASPPNALVAPFWDDLHQRNGTAYHGLVSDGRFAVQWTDWGAYSPSSGVSNTFQVLFSPDGTLEFQYGTMSGGSYTSATVGIEDDDATTGLQVVADAAYVASDKAVRFEGSLVWVSVDARALSVDPGASEEVAVTFDAAELPSGTYTADLVIRSNDPVTPTRTVALSLTVGSGATVAGEAGWRMIAAPAAGLTVDALAALNLVQGVPGYYPSAETNLYTGYDGAAYTVTGAGAELASGAGAFWYLYDQDLVPGGPSNSVELPMTLSTALPLTTTDTDISLSAAGDGSNLLGNPFGTGLDVSDVGSWPGAAALSSTVVQVWDANLGSYLTSATVPVLSTWQGFWAEAGSAGTLTIPASAQTTGGTFVRERTQPTIAFELATPDGARRDRAAVVRFAEDAETGADRADAAKRAPAAAAFVMLAAEAEGGALRAVETLPLPEAAAARVPLHVRSIGAGADLVLRWPTVAALPEGWTAELRDLETGAVVDLSAQTEYAFSVVPEAGQDALVLDGLAERTGAARFELVVGPASLVSNEGAGADELSLAAPFPNPSRERAQVSFSLAEGGSARLSVIDALGREVAVLAAGEFAAGAHAATLDTSRLASGLYVLRLAAGGQVLVQRATVTR